MTLSPTARVRSSPLPSSQDAGCLSVLCVNCGANIGVIDCLTSGVGDTRVECPACKQTLKQVCGIWRAIPEPRLRHYEKFIEEYQTVRALEGRGSANARFYLALPHKDLTGANQDQWKIRARTFDYLDHKVLTQLPQTHPSVLDIGAGNCWLSYRLALRQFRPVAVDLLVNDLDGLGAASHYLRELRIPFPRFQAEMDHLPFSSDQFDCVIFNASCHYSENYSRTLKEAIRCLRPRGLVVIADTPWYRCDESGVRMLEERGAYFRRRFGFPSDGLASLEYLTDSRLELLEKQFGLKWTIHTPNYGIRWAARPWIAKLRNRREPSQFRIYTAEVTRQ